jgi:oxygen-independent coproporphyrinogen III oxidase
MAGIYLHIPWCRKVCIYCDFHFTVSMRNKNELIKCMKKEMELQKEYLGGEEIDSVYFGGGTPSVLNPDELNGLLNQVKANFSVTANPEITLEANPDDMSVPYLEELNNSGINMLSIGIQSFFDDDLKWMNRRHDGRLSLSSIGNSRKAGFENISIDLIYGLPGMSLERWHKNLETAFESNVQHISAYHLTLENKTVYAYKVKKGIFKEPDEENGSVQFEMLMDMALKEGYIHYEISNFCMPGFMSRHNTSYWLRKPYIGIGPSANSYNGHSRQWNVRNNSEYIRSVNQGIIPCKSEQLSMNDRYNEYVLTSLRTVWGADIGYIRTNFGQAYQDHFLKESARFLEEGRMERRANSFVMSRSGKFFADGIISDFFIAE